MNDENTKELIVTTTNNPTIAQKPFPTCLLDINSYTGIKGLVGIFCWIGCLYFIYGLIHLLMWESTFWGIVWNIFTKPIYFIYHFSVFSFIYCLTWATFELQSFKQCLGRIIIIIICIIYMFSPIDAIPDLTPIIGQTDDLLALIIAIFNAVSIFKNKPNIINVNKK